jgi:hypothetical protein
MAPLGTELCPKVVQPAHWIFPQVVSIARVSPPTYQNGG